MGRAWWMASVRRPGGTLRRSKAGRRNLRSTQKPQSANGNAGGGSVVQDVELHEEASQSYLSYALSVIIGRALPDVRDGLKPVHRRTLFAMSELGLQSDKPFRKSARVVGEVLGKLHPHGDNAVYQSLVRMAQPFSLREPLIEGHGNFGSLDNDPPAAMRYTECRLQSVSEKLLFNDLTQASVPWQENFDGSMQEPVVLPTRLPNLLLNGAQGIAVGMTTQVPSHNLSELADAVSLVAKNPNATLNDVLRVMPGPDLPTGGILIDRREVRSVYADGMGSLTIRAKMHVEKVGQREALVISEIPYSTNKSALVERIAELVTKKTLQGVSDVRDESDREGLRLVVETKRNADVNEIHSLLLKHTRLELKMNCNMVVLRGREPVRMCLMEQLHEFTKFRRVVIRNKASERLGAAQKRAHTLNGLITALENSNTVISTLQNAESNKEASERLQSGLSLSAEQAEAILGMSLRRLTGQERGKLEHERDDLEAEISQLRTLLDSDDKIAEQLQLEAEELKRECGDGRRTKLLSQEEREEIERNPSAALYGFETPDRLSFVTLTQCGYAKRVDPGSFGLRGRGAKGVIASKYSEKLDRFAAHVACTDQDSVMAFTEAGFCSVIPSRRIPEASRDAVGESFANSLLSSKSDRVVSCMLAAHGVEGASENHALLMSRQGMALHLRMNQLASASNGTLQVMTLKKNDSLQRARNVSENQGKEASVIAVSCTGRANRFSISDVPLRNRNALGLLTLRLKGNDTVADMATADGFSDELMLVTQQGQCIRYDIDQIPVGNRRTGGKGAINLSSGDFVACAEAIGPADAHKNVLLTTSTGYTTRMRLSDLPVLKRRGGKGVKAMDVNKGDAVIDLGLVESESELKGKSEEPDNGSAFLAESEA